MLPPSINVLSAGMPIRNAGPHTVTLENLIGKLCGTGLNTQRRTAGNTQRTGASKRSGQSPMN